MSRLIYKIISIIEETAELILMGTGTSNGSPQLSEVFMQSRAGLGLRVAALEPNEKNKKIFMKQAQNSLTELYTSPPFTLEDVERLYEMLRDRNIITYQHFSSIKGHGMLETVKTDLKNRKYNALLVDFVFKQLEEYYQQFRAPRQAVNFRQPTHALLKIVREGLYSTVLIDTPPGLNTSFDNVTRGRYKDITYNRSLLPLEETINTLMKKYVPEYDKLIMHQPIPYVTNVLYTHAHYDHAGGSDYFRELYWAYDGKPIVSYGLSPVFNKIQRISPQYFKPMIIEFNKRDSNEVWDEKITNLRNALSTFKPEFKSQFQSEVDILAKKGYYVTMDIHEITKEHILKNIERPLHLRTFLESKGIEVEKSNLDFIEYALPYNEALMPVIIESLSSDERKYPEMKVGPLDTKVIPLDIGHGQDIEEKNRLFSLTEYSRTVGGIKGVNIENHDIPHHILGYYFPEYKLAYITDAKVIPPSTMALLKEQGVDHLVINGLHWNKQHLNHLSILDAVNAIYDLNPINAYIVHVTKNVYTVKTNEMLRRVVAGENTKRGESSRVESIAVAYDGQSIPLKRSEP